MNLDLIKTALTDATFDHSDIKRDLLNYLEQLKISLDVLDYDPGSDVEVAEEALVDTIALVSDDEEEYDDEDEDDEEEDEDEEEGEVDWEADEETTPPVGA